MGSPHHGEGVPSRDAPVTRVRRWYGRAVRNKLGRLLASTLLVAACSESASDPPLTEAVVPAGASPVAAALALGTSPLAISERGVPRLLHGNGVPAAPATTATESAKTHLARLAPAWGLRGTLPELVGAGEVAVEGGKIARVTQVIDGMPVDRRELRVLVGQGGTLVAASGEMIAGDAPRTAAAFVDDDAGAIARFLGERGYGAEASAG